jgi:glucose dehydrogenase
MPKARIVAFRASLSAVALLFSPPIAAQHNGARPAAGAVPPDDGQWLMPGKDVASTRYTALNQINRGNVGRLELAFTFDTRNDRGHEAAPLVVGSMMYIVTPYPNHVWALDLARG